MNKKAYKNIVEKIKQLIFKEGKPLYIIAPQIGINDCTLKRFLDGKGVNIFTVMTIADYYNIKIFS